MREIALCKYKKSSNTRRPQTIKTQPTPQRIWCEHSKCYIYTLINIHPGNPKVTHQYIHNIVPLTHDTPVNRQQVAEMLSLEETIKKAITHHEDSFIIDGIVISSVRAKELLKESLTDLYAKFHE